MAPTVGSRLKHAWNAFTNSDYARGRPMSGEASGYGSSIGGRPDRMPLRFSNERTLISSIYSRIAIDAAAVPMVHCRNDDQDRYMETIDSGLNRCLNVAANIDQKARAFRQDVVMTILDEGAAAIVPVDTTNSPEFFGGYDIKTLRVGRITQWFPEHVRVSLYNQQRGMREEITLPKTMVAIVENPLYAVMNEPNSTLQRLIITLGNLDAVDNQSASGKLDLLVQLPYTIKTESKRQQAEQRRKDLEFQLSGSQYGIGYVDAAEKITQLNRPAENNLMARVIYLTDQLYVQLGLTPEIVNGTADEKTMKNYYARTIEPLLDSVVEAYRWAFLTQTARTQGQSVDYFRDPFKFVPIGGEGGIADIADKFSRNEIVSSNEIRQAIGMRPRPEAKADALINSNMPQGKTGVDIGNGNDGTTDTVDSTAEEIAPALPDPATSRTIAQLNAASNELDAVLSGGG